MRETHSEAELAIREVALGARFEVVTTGCTKVHQDELAMHPEQRPEHRGEWVRNSKTEPQ